MEEFGSMKTRSVNAARRWVAIAVPLALVLTLATVWSVWADDPPSVAGNAQLLYQFSLTDSSAEQIQIVLPHGFEYAGLAPGSTVTARPDISANGEQAAWQGPFPEGSVLRFWLVPLGSEAAPETLSVNGMSGDVVRIDPATILPEVEETAAAAPLVDGAVTMTKTVEPAEYELGDYLLVTYQVVFSNQSATDVTLDAITDTLPSGFSTKVTPSWCDEVGAPTAVQAGPVAVWTASPATDLTVLANDTLTLCYNATPPQHAGEYQNSVVAKVGSETIGPESATMTIEGNRIMLPIIARNYQPPAPVWDLTKTASATEIDVDGTVDYTVQIHNSGNLAGTVTNIADALPNGMTFVDMLPGSSIGAPPSGTTGTISWTGTWSVPPGASLIVKYRVQGKTGGQKTNTVTVYESGGQVAGTASSTVLVGGGLPFNEDFSYSAMQNWEILLNWPDLSQDRWYWSGDNGVWGVYSYEYDRVLPAYEGYALAMYTDPRAQGWTNYKIEARLEDIKEENRQKGLTGIWFRGTYQNSGAMDGKTVGGYYVYMKPGDDHLYLGRITPSNPMFASQEFVASYAYGPRIGHKHWYKVVIEVQGFHIKVKFGDNDSNLVTAFDWTDPNQSWPNGTVGLATYNTSARFDYIHVTALP
jgi:uncharacterized repeat protein (TIGR01451 family)